MRLIGVLLLVTLMMAGCSSTVTADTSVETHRPATGGHGKVQAITAENPN